MSKRKRATSGECSEVKLFPLPYFPLDLAADQLGVSVKFVEEAIKSGLVRPCVLLDDPTPQKSFSPLIGDENILENVEVYCSTSSSSSDIYMGYSPLIRPKLSNIDDYLSTPASQLNVTEYDRYPDNEGGVEGYLMGFWQIGRIEDAIRLLTSSEEINIEVVPYLDECWYEERSTQTAKVKIMGFPVTVSARNLVISYFDIKRLLIAFMQGKQIDQRTLYGVANVETDVSEPAVRPSQKMMLVLAGVIATNPKLGKECLGKNKNLPELLATHFAYEGLSLGTNMPDPSTIRRWMQGMDFNEMLEFRQD